MEWLNKNLERYFKKAGNDKIIADGIVFFGKRISEKEFYLKDWRENTFLVTRTEENNYLVEFAEHIVLNYITVVCYHDNKIVKIILCEDAQEVNVIMSYAKLPFCEYNKIEIHDNISFKHGTSVIFYKTALEYIKEHLPI